MKVLFCRWNIIGEQDVLEGIKSCGYEVEVFHQVPASVDYDVEYMKHVSELMMREGYQYIFSLNFIPIISRVCNIFEIPYISWSVDCPEIMLFSKTLSLPCNYIFLFDQYMVQKFSYRNPGHVFYMPLGANVERLHKIRPTKEEREKLGADISFIGSLYTEKSKYRTYQMDKELPDYWKGYYEGLVEAQLKVYGYNFLEDAVTEEMAEEFKKYARWNDLPEDYLDVTKETVVEDFLGLRCTELERVRLLGAIAKKFSIDLYTKSGRGFVPEANYRGIIDYANGMTKVFKSSKINLNFTSKSIKTGIPLRIFDILGAGGFLITNYQKELPEYFEIGKELVVYENEADLLQKIQYYLEHDEEREKIAENGKKKVENLYTWKHRIEDIMAIMEEKRYKKINKLHKNCK